jgi:SAM-dependent methyltransferase
MRQTVRRQGEASFPPSEAGKRYRWFKAQMRRAQLLEPEQFTPTIEVPVPNRPTDLMLSREDMTEEEAAKLGERVAALRPWGYSIHLGKGLYTDRHKGARMLFRVRLITGAVAELCEIKGASVLDIACNHGYFGLELASRGAVVEGIDLRERNIEKARLLAEHFRIKNVGFSVGNAYDATGQYDIVYNLGLFYHVTDPYRLMALTYRLARKVAVIDTVTHTEPFSGFIQGIGSDTSRPGKGEFSVELHPTYRGLLDLVGAVGFSKVIEAVPAKAPDAARHPYYERRQRRCFIAFK